MPKLQWQTLTACPRAETEHQWTYDVTWQTSTGPVVARTTFKTLRDGTFACAMPGCPKAQYGEAPKNRNEYKTFQHVLRYHAVVGGCSYPALERWLDDEANAKEPFLTDTSEDMLDLMEKTGKDAKFIQNQLDKKRLGANGNPIDARIARWKNDPTYVRQQRIGMTYGNGYTCLNCGAKNDHKSNRCPLTQEQRDVLVERGEAYEPSRRYYPNPNCPDYPDCDLCQDLSVNCWKNRRKVMEVIPGEVMPDDEVVEIWDELKTRPFSLSYLGGNPRARQAFGQLEKMELTIEDVARDGASAFGDLSLLFSVRVCKQTLCGDDTVDDESVVVISRAANTVPPLVPKRFWLAGVAGAKPPGHPHNVEQARDASAVCSLFVEDVERHKNGGPHKLEDHLHRHVANPAASRPCESRVRNVETSLDFMTRAAPSNHQGKAQIKSERPQGSRADTTVSAASPASPVSARPLPRLPTAPAAKRVGVSALSSTTAPMLGTRPTVSAASLASPMSAKPLPRLLPAPVAKRDGVPASSTAPKKKKMKSTDKPTAAQQAFSRPSSGRPRSRRRPRPASTRPARAGASRAARRRAAPAPMRAARAPAPRPTPMVMGDEPDEPDEPATASDGARLALVRAARGQAQPPAIMATFESATATFDVCTLSPKRELIADAAGALALVETMPAALRGVKLGNKSYTAAAAAALAGRLKGLRGLVDVDIADVIAGRPEAEALEVLAHLSGALAAPLAAATPLRAAERRRAPLRPRTSRHTLDLADNSFGDDGGEAIAAWLADSAAASPSAAAPLKKLVLRDCLRGNQPLATALLATNELASKGALLLVSALLAKAPAR
ncbi:hypothetical protein SO694_00107024 [Aureococcus anophagefferens]|uniref:CCHC-type domain-containing protein n=1 Tax=Aureococcus anophagefferens TaxID=44056 RepID=A0ABR1FMI0_AURAN